MYFKQILAGGYNHNFSYFIGDEKTREVAVVDPVNLSLLEKFIAMDGLFITAIFGTHGHFDHIGEIPEFYKKHANAKIYVPKSTREKLSQLPNGTFHILSDREKINIGAVSMEAIFTPGHEPGATCFLVEGKLITGDTLFIEGCGRCDLPDSDVEEQYKSLFERIGGLPETTEIYPGHDYGSKPHSTLAYEKQHNRFYRCKTKDEFVALRMK
ncbi:MAG: hypothetical protein UY05_C0070G0003 [Candidatus Peregrinibacteria bacterium GW2011_GWA2_47_7]|nr:MAG: hypothetical protein UY05_C0070G0003 [Candidatus Peregrinibacteria bacterium GW2011_GWA2_47_7]